MVAPAIETAKMHPLAAAASPTASSSAAAAPSATTTKTYSFAPSSLERRDFSPKQFIRDHRPHAPLSVLRDDLRAHVASLSTQIVHELQGDFYHFIYPPVSLADVPALSDALTPSLHALRDRLEHLHASLGAQAESLRSSLDAHHDLLARRSQLCALLEAHDGLVKLERLLQSPPKTNTSSSSASTSSTKSTSAKSSSALDPLSPPALAHLHRVASETAKLSFVVARAPNGPFLRTLTPRVSAVTRAARAALEQVLHPALACLSDGNPALLARVLGLFLAAGQPDAALDSFSRVVVSPFAASLRMSSMIALAEREAGGTTGSGTGVSGSGSVGAGKMKPVAGATPAEALRAAQGAIARFLEDRVAPVVAVVTRDSELAPHLDVVGVAVWPTVQRALARQMAPAFSPGLPDVFHAAFLAGQDILADMHKATDERFRSSFLESSATSDFRRTWNLPVYFQLRFQEIASSFETQLEAGLTGRKGKSSPNEAAAKTKQQPGTTEKASQSSSSMTAPAADTDHSESHLLRNDVYTADASVALIVALRRCWHPRVFLRALTHRFVRLSLQLLARYTTWVRVGLAGAWPESDDAGASGAASVARDVATLQRRLPAELASILRARLRVDPDDEGDAALVDDMDAAFVKAVDALATVMPDLLRAIADALARKCVANLQPLRGILATYRMSSKQAPTSHSSFVPKILRPLRAFLREHDAALPTADTAKVAVDVAETTAAEYCAMATDLLQRNKSSEATLRRLNIGRGGAGGAAGGAVVEKIATQLFLDVEKFSDEIAGFGIDSASVPSLESLRTMVRRERSEVERGGDEVEQKEQKD